MLTQQKPSTVTFVLFVLLLSIGGISQSLMWNTPPLVIEYGFNVVIALVSATILIICGLLFQAERLIVNVYNPFSISEPASVYPPRRSFFLSIFVISTFVGGVIITSHHLIVASWQTNITFSILTEPTKLSGVELLITNQNNFIGDFSRQIITLFLMIAGLCLVALLIYARLFIAFIFIISTACLLGVFGWLFSKLTFNDLGDLFVEPSNDLDYLAVIRITLESSLAGFGVMFGACRWMPATRQHGWILPMLITLICFYGLIIIVGWFFASFSWIGSSLNASRLLFHLPYFLTHANDGLLGWLWLFLAPLLIWIKLAVILSFGAIIISRILQISFISAIINMVLLGAFLSCCWLLISEFFHPSQGSSYQLLFGYLFENFFYWWYPIHIGFLCLLALCQSADEHADFVFLQNYRLGQLLRYSYFVLFLFICWFFYQTVLGNL